MAIKILYSITKKDIEETSVYKNSLNPVTQIITSNNYIKCLNNWLTVCHYKGIEHVLGLYHIGDFDTDLINLFYDNSISKQFIKKK